MITIIDYGMGNLRSVEKAFQKVGAGCIVTDRPEDIDRASSVVLPGVGAFKDCMDNLRRLGLIEPIKAAIEGGRPFLGICLGMQVLFEDSSEFGTTEGLGILKGHVVKFEASSLKIPHMGWNRVRLARRPPIFDGISDNEYFYFVHSYYVYTDDKGIISGATDYGGDFTSMVWRDNLFATQFHPEKSQSAGLKIIENFSRL